MQVCACACKRSPCCTHPAFSTLFTFRNHAGPFFTVCKYGHLELGQLPPFCVATRSIETARIKFRMHVRMYARTRAQKPDALMSVGTHAFLQEVPAGVGCLRPYSGRCYPAARRYRSHAFITGCPLSCLCRVGKAERHGHGEKPDRGKGDRDQWRIRPVLILRQGFDQTQFQF